MSALESKIKIELWSPGGKLLMDITGLASNRSITKVRNDADQISFDIDLKEFERLAALMNEDPSTLLIANNTEVRVSSRGVYIAGGQIVQPRGILNPTQEIIQTKAYGFLNLMSSRFTDYDELYTAVETTSVVTAQLAYTQSLPNGNIGIVVGHVETIGPLTWEFHQQDIKSSWQDLANQQAGGFDMEITADKKLNLYALQGVHRSDMYLEYGSNIKSVVVDVDGTQSANEIIALGAGIGAQATVQLPIIAGETQLLPTSAFEQSNPNGVIALDNVPAQQNTTLLQALTTYNGVSDPNVLLASAESDMSATAYPVTVIQVEYELNGPYLSDITIGDYIPVDLTKHPYYRGIKGYYRLEKYEAAIDDEDNVYATLYLS